MADNSVFITGAAKGAFEEALDGLPSWSTEKTAKAIEKQLKLQTGILSDLVKNSSGKGNTSNELRTSELDKAISDIIKQTEKEIKALEDKASQDKKDQKKKKQYQKENDAQHAVNLMATAATTKLILSINGAMTDNINTYAALQQGGINVVAGLDSAGNGFTALQQLTSLTGVRFTELSATMLKYSTSINAFTTGKFAKTLGKSVADLEQFGFSSKEAGELLGSYLEAQSGYTDITKKSVDENAESLKTFGKGLSRLSMITGMSKNAILSNMEAISKSNEASVLSTQVGNEAATATLAFISSIKNQQFGKTLLKMMTDQIKPLNATFMSFQKIGAGGFMSKFMNFTQSLNGMSEVAKNRALKDYEMRHHVEIENIKRQANLYSQFPEMAGAANEVLTTIAGMQQTTNTMSNLTNEQLAKLEKTNEARSKLSTQWENLMSKFQSYFSLPISLLNAMGNSLEMLNTALDNTAKAINSVFGEETTSWIGAGISATAMLLGLSKGAQLLGLAATSTGKVVGSSMLTGFGKFITFMGNLPGKIMSGIFKFFSGGVRGMFSTIGGIFSKSFGAIAKVFSTGSGFIGKIFSTIGGMVLKFAGVVGWLVTAFQAGYALGTYIYDMVKDFSWFTDMMDTIFKGLDRILQYLPGSIGSDAKERLENSAKIDALNVSNTSQPAISKSPAPSTIDSPSSTQASTTNVTNLSNTTTTPASSANEKSSTGLNISELIASTNTILQNLLDATHNTVSVNKDILRYTKTGL